MCYGNSAMKAFRRSLACNLIVQCRHDAGTFAGRAMYKRVKFRLPISYIAYRSSGQLLNTSEPGRWLR